MTPMLPIQLLTVNLLCDLSRTTIPWDELDPEYLSTPKKWHVWL
jgi:Mg2+-importing ATPase